MTCSGTMHDIYVACFDTASGNLFTIGGASLGTIDHETRKTDHTGTWPVWSIRGQQRLLENAVKLSSC